MKYSQLIGIIACIGVIGICFLPWSYIASMNVTVTGVNGYVSDELTFGKPIVFYITLFIPMVLFFTVPKIWAKRTNVFLGAIVLGYSIYNYLLYTTCRAGECPEKKSGIFLLVICTTIIQIMALLPKMRVPQKKA